MAVQPRQNRPPGLASEEASRKGLSEAWQVGIFGAVAAVAGGFVTASWFQSPPSTPVSLPVLSCDQIPDARQALACRSISWQRETLINALTQGDAKTVAQFVKGGWKLGSDEFFHLVRNDSVQPAVMQPIVDVKAVTGFEFCKGYKELAQIVGLPAPMPMPDGSVRFKTLDDAYLQDVEALSRNKARWSQFVAMCGRSELRRHYDGLIEATTSSVSEQKLNQNSPPSATECRTSLRKKFPLLELVNNPRLPDADKIAHSLDDRFLMQFYTGYDPRRGDWKRWEQVYASAVETACSNPPRPQTTAGTQRMERLQAIRAAIP